MAYFGRLRRPYDLIVLDQMLPYVDGLTLLRALRASAIRTPVLFLTTKGGIKDRVEGLDAGADDYLVKPFAFSELAARVDGAGPSATADAGRDETHGREPGGGPAIS